jgi:uncharacterized protein
MELLEQLANSTLPGKVLDIQVGLFRTAVVVETRFGIQCGLAATLVSPQLEHCRESPIRQAGWLHTLSSKDLVDLVHSGRITEVSIGLAAINALLPPLQKDCKVWEENGEEYIFREGFRKRVVVVGHFPFVEQLPKYASQSWVLELEPKPGDLPASAASEVLPQAEIVAITATTLINGTFDGLIPYCQPGCEVMLLGPSTPLSPVLFDHGLTLLSGTIVDNPRHVVDGISQGANLRQLFQEGWIRYVIAKRENGNGHS